MNHFVAGTGNFHFEIMNESVRTMYLQAHVTFTVWFYIYTYIGRFTT
jgi:hypothetical protein